MSYRVEYICNPKLQHLELSSSTVRYKEVKQKLTILHAVVGVLYANIAQSYMFRFNISMKLHSMKMHHVLQVMLSNAKTSALCIFKSAEQSVCCNGCVLTSCLITFKL